MWRDARAIALALVAGALLAAGARADEPWPAAGLGRPGSAPLPWPRWTLEVAAGAALPTGGFADRVDPTAVVEVAGTWQVRRGQALGLRLGSWFVRYAEQRAPVRLPGYSADLVHSEHLVAATLGPQLQLGAGRRLRARLHAGAGVLVSTVETTVGETGLGNAEQNFSDGALALEAGAGLAWKMADLRPRRGSVAMRPVSLLLVLRAGLLHAPGARFVPGDGVREEDGALRLRPVTGDADVAVVSLGLALGTPDAGQ